MIIDFTHLDLRESPMLILRKADGEPLGALVYAYDVETELLYNEVSQLTFEYPAWVDGVSAPLYDELVGFRIVDLQGIGQFILMNPSERGEGIKRVKRCNAYSLEYEFTFKKITLSKDTYRFYDTVEPETSLLGIILSYMPSWHIGTVPSALISRYRTFEVNNETIYNFIKNTVQQSYSCIINFDTYTRTIYVDDVSRVPDDQPIYLSADNLATEIEVTELTEDIVTRLDVNGADGVTIRDVNPTGTNKIINLDYYMTTDNFPADLVEKYRTWVEVIDQNRQAYYSYSIRYTLALEQITLEQAKLTDLNGEMVGYDNLRASIIQAIAQGLKSQEDLDSVNADIAAKQTEIDKKTAEIKALEEKAQYTFDLMKQIVDTCSYNNYFTDAERIQLDRYIRDGEITDSSFVTSDAAYAAPGSGEEVGDIGFSVTGATITAITPDVGGTIYDIRGGFLNTEDGVTALVISATVDCLADSTFIASFYLSDPTYSGVTYNQGCLTVAGKQGPVSIGSDLSSITFDAYDAYRYFTINVSEYEKRSIAWELYEYGSAMLNKLAKPSYQFNITSANFLAHEDFVSFKNALRLGEHVYTELRENEIVTPICIGVSFVYGDYDSLKLSFSDKYTSGSGGNFMVDLLNQSVSMGKTLNLSQYTYAQFTDSGANTSIAEFMTNALDVSKNALFSSTGNAVTMDGTGLRLRKFTDASQTAYAPEQVWMVNNSIMLTADNWKTAQIGIGKFHDENLGDVWGIVAPAIVGTLLAGNELVIESAKKDGGVSVFRVDEHGARLYNADFLLANNDRSIVLNPDLGVAIGPVGSYTVDEDGVYSVDPDVANFYVNDSGDVFLRGAVTATELHIGNQTIESYVDAMIDQYDSETDNGTYTFYSPEPPTEGYKVGDLWKDSDSQYHYIYTAVGVTGDPDADWVMMSTDILEGAAINTNANTGVIDIVSASALNIASGTTLSLVGQGAVNLGSAGGINLTAGRITLGSSGNTITAQGVLSLASGNICLDGPNNLVTIGNNQGVVNIGTDGTGVINLATYQVQSSTETAKYTSLYSTGGKTATTDSTSTIEYTATDADGNASPTSFTITTTYLIAESTSNEPPSITDGKLLQLVYKNRGINVYADAGEDSERMILAPSVKDGHLMGWGLISATNVAATNMSATTIVADGMFLPGIDGTLTAVADQKWTIDKIVEILNNNDVIPGLKTAINNVSWRMSNHSHQLVVGDSGSVSIGSITTVGGSGTNFNMADTTWYKNQVSAFKSAVSTSLGNATWGGGGSTTIYTTVVADASARTVVLKTQMASAMIAYPGDTGATNVGISLGELDLTSDLQEYSDSVYTAGVYSVMFDKKEWSGGILVITTTNGLSSTAQLSKGTETWDGNTVSFPILDGGASTGYTVTVDATSVYNNGWNDCRSACTRTSSVYTISQTAPGTLYLYVNGNYTSAGSDWVKVTPAVAYNRPAAK